PLPGDIQALATLRSGSAAWVAIVRVGRRAEGYVTERDPQVPPALAVAAAWCWRLIVIGIVIYAVAHIIDVLRLVVIPCAIALLLCALLHPLTAWLRRAMPSLAATWVTMLVALGVLGGVGAFVGIQANEQFPHLLDRIKYTVRQAQNWLVTGPLHLKH